MRAPDGISNVVLHIFARIVTDARGLFLNKDIHGLAPHRAALMFEQNGNGALSVFKPVIMHPHLHLAQDGRCDLTIGANIRSRF